MLVFMIPADAPPSFDGHRESTYATVHSVLRSTRQQLHAQIAAALETHSPEMMENHPLDSFQGNEADVVIISLVRNNHHAGVRSALGFLSDPRRLNVLLSRARWRMVLVGSLDFLQEILRSTRKTEAGLDITFLNELLAGLEAERCAKTAVIMPPAILFGEKIQ